MAAGYYFHLVPIGDDLGRGVVICRGETHNIWKTEVKVMEDVYGYTGMTEGEAQLEGLKMQPGTMMPSEVDTAVTHMQNEYGIDITTEQVTVGGETITVETLIRDYTRNVPEWMTPWRRGYFDIRRWT